MLVKVKVCVSELHRFTCSYCNSMRELACALSLFLSLFQAVWAGCGPAAHWQVLMALLAKAKGAVLALGSRCSLPLPARAVPLAAGITLRASLPTIITNSSCRWRQAGAPVAASSTAFSHLHIPPHKMLKHTPF